MSERKSPRTGRASVKRNIRKFLKSELFYSDIDFDTMLYGMLLRSPSANGIVTSISYPDLPEGFYFFTASNIPGNNAITIENTTFPLFCSGNVSYIGEPLGILVGPDSNIVKELLSKFEIIYDTQTAASVLDSLVLGEQLPVIASDSKTAPDPEEIAAIANSMNLTPLPYSPSEKTESAETPIDINNVLNDDTAAARTVRTGAALSEDTEEFNRVFKDSDYVITNTWNYRLKKQICTETNGCVCLKDADTVYIFSPTQWVTSLKEVCSSALDISRNNLCVKKTITSEANTNGIWRNSIIAAQTGLAAVLTGKPVKLEFSREEQDKYINNPVPMTFTYKTALSKDGLFTAVDIAIDMNVGAYNPFAQEIIDRTVVAAFGLYKTPNLKITATAHKTHTPPSSQNYNSIESQSYFALENQIQSICAQTNFSPIELRNRNLFTNKNLHVPVPFTFDEVDTAGTMNGILSLSDFNRKYFSYKMNSSQRLLLPETSDKEPVKGIGLAYAVSGYGSFLSMQQQLKQSIEIKLETNGKLTIHSVAPSDSIQNIWKETASRILGTPKTDITIDSRFSNGKEPILPDYAYDNISIMTQLLKKACTTIQRKRFRTPLPIIVKKGIAASRKNRWNPENFTGNPFLSTSFAAAVVEIEYNPFTFRTRIKGIWITIDCGEVFSEKAARLTIRKKIQQILSELVDNETEYCSNINISFLYSKRDPQQLEGLVDNVLPAAFSSALSQACGISLSALPITTDAIYKLAAKSKQVKKNDKKKEAVK